MTEKPPENNLTEAGMKFSEQKLIDLAHAYVESHGDMKGKKLSTPTAFKILVENNEGMDELSVKFLAEKLKEMGFFKKGEIPNPKTEEESLAESYQKDTLLGDEEPNEKIEGSEAEHKPRQHHTLSEKELKKRVWFPADRKDD